MRISDPATPKIELFLKLENNFQQLSNILKESS